MGRIGFGVVACLCGVGAALQLAAARLTPDRNHLLHHKLYIKGTPFVSGTR